MKLKSFRSSAALILTTLILMVAAATAQTYTDLFNFDRTSGVYPTGLLAQGRDGNLYGTVWEGGTNQCDGEGCGVVFKITPSGTLTVLHKFHGVDGSTPSGLTLGTDGKFYGTTEDGGANSYGTIFKITAGGP